VETTNPREQVAHYCPDWDFMYIKLNDPEMECCLCFDKKLEGK
jgi:hypothetical protein